MDIKDLGMVDSKGQEIIFLVQVTDFLDPGIILEVLGKLSKGLVIIFRVQKTDSQGHRLETTGIQENLNLVVEDHMISLLPKTSSWKEAVEDPKIMDLNMAEVVGAEEEHGGEVALDPNLLTEALEMSSVGSEVVEEAATDLDQEQMTRDCSSQILVHQDRLTKGLAHLEKMVVFPLKIGNFLQTFLVLLNLIVQSGTEKGAVHSTENRFPGLAINHPLVKVWVVKRI